LIGIDLPGPAEPAFTKATVRSPLSRASEPSELQSCTSLERCPHSFTLTSKSLILLDIAVLEPEFLISSILAGGEEISTGLQRNAASVALMSGASGRCIRTKQERLLRRQDLQFGPGMPLLFLLWPRTQEAAGESCTTPVTFHR
jgi:hypothetical protein